MPSKQYAWAFAAAFLAAGCASSPNTPAEQASAKPADKGQCYYRTGSNHCWREGGPSDVKTMSGDQVREAADENRAIHMPRTR